MEYKTLISTDELQDCLEESKLVLIDCRFNLMSPNDGREDYKKSHLPGAIYAHLDEDLSAPVVKGKTGRHPLPDPDVLAKHLSEWGIDKTKQVVAYDQMAGAIASRLWWLLRWMGHENVAVLDGGWPKWCEEGRPISDEIYQVKRSVFEANMQPQLLVTAEDLMGSLRNPNKCLLDARPADRFRGENEVLDTKAGHIPGAKSAPFMANLDSNGCFSDVNVLREYYINLQNGIPNQNTVVYCGSGVTAAHDILAMAHAGLGDCPLYVGSWSDWITDDNRPTVSGDTP